MFTMATAKLQFSKDFFRIFLLSDIDRNIVFKCPKSWMLCNNCEVHNIYVIFQFIILLVLGCLPFKL